MSQNGTNSSPADAPNLTWEEVAATYTKPIGLKADRVDEDTSLHKNPAYSFPDGAYR